MKKSNPIDELVHSLASPLNNVRLQLGLIRQNAGEKERERVDNADREVQRAQEIVVAVAEVTSGDGETCATSELSRHLRELWPDVADTTSGTLVLPLSAGRTRVWANLLIDGCNSLTSKFSVMLQLSDELVIRVEGEFETIATTRALRLTHVGVDGRAELALAKARLMVMAAGGSMELTEGALVVRIPVEGK